MKKIAIGLICILTVGVLPAKTVATTKEIVKQEVANKKIVPEIKKLEIGAVEIYTFDKIKLHAYKSNDPLNDVCYLIETEKELIGIEAVPFYNNIEEYTKYIKSLNKPLNNIFIAYHPNGLEGFNNANFVSTKSSENAFVEGGAVNGLIKYFSSTFGASFDINIPKVTEIKKTGTSKIGGIDFIITENTDGYELEIPAIKSVYTHMMGSNVHNILGSVAQIDSIINELTRYKSKGYILILTSHYAPEQMDAVDKKISYLKETKEIIKKSKTREEFTDSMKKSFSDYLGENYLNMSAQMLFTK